MDKFSSQIKEAMGLKAPRFKGYNKIVVCGMGGSGISGYVLKDLIDDVPVFVCQSFHLPKFIDSKTLVFVISYSGNTDEAISMYKEARKKTNMIALITSGGILGNEGRNVIKIASGLQPRQALGYLFFPMWKSLGKGIGNVMGIVDSVKNDLGIARKLHNKFPVIFTNSGFYSVALRWKQQINEDSKRLAVASVFPEINHNEIEARYDNSKIVFLRDNDEKAMRLLRKGEDVLEVKLLGKTKLEKIFYGLVLANFVSVELARLNGEDYEKYRYIERLKAMK